MMAHFFILFSVEGNKCKGDKRRSKDVKVQIFVRLAAARAPPLPDTILTKLTLAHSLLTSFRLEIIDLEPQTKPSNLNSTNFSNNLLIVYRRVSEF